MTLIISFLLIPLAVMLLIPFSNPKWKSLISLAGIILNAGISGYFAVLTLLGHYFSFTFPGSLITGEIPVRIDALSGWFILIINLVFITGSMYGLFYIKAYATQKNNLTMHNIALIFVHAASIYVTVVQNSLAFLIGWEILAISAFLMIILEHEKTATLKAGINYLIQSHFSLIILMIGFMWIAHKTGSYDFTAIQSYSATVPATASMMLFLIFFIGFAIKAGFVPFHTWLPYAHPVAPAHMSGMMSGVIIKIGIFGMLRMLLIIKTDYYTIGFIILLFSVISGLYGVMLAILQHNLKKLLAYHSIENIGIIGIGIGLGCIGLGSNNQVLTTLGFTGALLHTLNHALFKSLLFYAAGNIYQTTHTLDIEHLGGLIKRMPQTAILFLISAIAISGIPPFNGFVSEFIIYTALYSWLGNANLVSVLSAIFTMAALVLIGGLALLCFTKAFGVVFLGNARRRLPDSCKEVSIGQLIPLYFITLLIVLIGIFPQAFIQFLSRPVNLFTISGLPDNNPFDGGIFDSLQSINFAAMGLVILITFLLVFRRFVLRHRTSANEQTWGCGYSAPTSKQQYTAGSFVRTYSKLFQAFFILGKEEKNIQGIFPVSGKFVTHPYDKIERWLIDKPLKNYKSFMGRFVFLQNGKLQFYILYGIVFILSVIVFPLIYNNLLALFDFFKNL
ncbi:MAG: hypothetical protein K0B15_14975 [Lentimicrobium sp.]|nr:hypothetical protein [Lentimicrobium sp.]